MNRKEIYPKMLILVGGGLIMNGSPVLFCILFITPYMIADFKKNKWKERERESKGEQAREKLGIPVEDGLEGIG